MRGIHLLGGFKTQKGLRKKVTGGGKNVVEVRQVLPWKKVLPHKKEKHQATYHEKG